MKGVLSISPQLKLVVLPCLIMWIASSVCLFQYCGSFSSTAFQSTLYDHGPRHGLQSRCSCLLSSLLLCAPSSAFVSSSQSHQCQSTRNPCREPHTPLPSYSALIWHSLLSSGFYVGFSVI